MKITLIRITLFLGVAFFSIVLLIDKMFQINLADTYIVITSEIFAGLVLFLFMLRFALFIALKKDVGRILSYTDITLLALAIGGLILFNSRTFAATDYMHNAKEYNFWRVYLPLLSLAFLLLSHIIFILNAGIAVSKRLGKK
ncbi:MAG: hypothetical protein ITG00_09980 [Flavobacterium sp.]|nr:hypothetical protein [Flavobacterium sp.]